MEGAARVFAGEFSRSTLLVPSGDADVNGWVVTPGGAWCRQMYVVGVLTEVIENGDLHRCRVADPTGAFDIVIGRRNAPLARALGEIPVPSFVAVTGCARLFQKNSAYHLSVHPEQITEIDRAYRDQILLTTAEYTLRRLDRIRLAILGEITDEKIRKTIRHYAISPAMIQELVLMVESAVQAIRPPAAAPAADPSMVHSAVMGLVQTSKGPRGIAIEEILETLALQGIRKEDVLATIEALVVDDECYQPQKGYIRQL